MARSEYEVAGGCYLFGEESIAVEHEGGAFHNNCFRRIRCGRKLKVQHPAKFFKGVLRSS